MKLKRSYITIPITLNNPRKAEYNRTIDSYRVEGTDFFVNRTVLSHREWSVTHSSGLAVTKSLPKRSVAVELIKEIQPLINWSFTTYKQADAINKSGGFEEVKRVLEGYV